MKPIVPILLSAGLCGAASSGCHGRTCEELRACVVAKDGSAPNADNAAGASDPSDSKAQSVDAGEARTSDAGSAGGSSANDGGVGRSQSEQAGGTGSSAGTPGGSPEDIEGDGRGGATAPKPGNQDAGGALVDCGAPPKPSHGEVLAPSTTLGSTAAYTCKEGYYQRGVQDRKCQATGTWSDATPTCEFVDCKELASPTNGSVQAARTTYGAEAKYTCQDGYHLTGSSSRTCQPDGTWSEAAAACALKDCGPLSNPTRGEVAVTGTSYGSTATYTCAAPSLLTGSATRTCATDGKWTGSAPECRPLKSCEGGQVGAGMDCGGANGTDDCCASPLVEGGSFDRDNNPDYPATVSSFRLDKYEITVGRFRAFVAAGMGTSSNPPASGSGANPRVAGSGWDAAWNAQLTGTTAALTNAVQCKAAYQTWTGNNDQRPINCLTWYEAFAFCIWDGGRLPTELEWNYAAAGGSEQRKYPWGSAAPGPNADLAVYGFNGNPCAGVGCIGPVGSAAGGNGKWGQSDLAGNVLEWNLDWSADYPSSCRDCANIGSAAGGVMRGGSFELGATSLLSSVRYSATPSSRSSAGARCARTP